MSLRLSISTYILATGTEIQNCFGPDSWGLIPGISSNICLAAVSKAAATLAVKKLITGDNR